MGYLGNIFVFSSNHILVIKNSLITMKFSSLLDFFFFSPLSQDLWKSSVHYLFWENSSLLFFSFWNWKGELKMPRQNLKIIFSLHSRMCKTTHMRFWSPCIWLDKKNYMHGKIGILSFLVALLWRKKPAF